MSLICDDIPNTEDVKKGLRGNVSSMVKVQYNGERKISGLDATKLAHCVLPSFYKKHANNIESFKVHPDDVWVASFPKCGMRMTQEMVWLIANDLNYGLVKNSPLTSRYGFIELSGILRGMDWTSDQTSIELVADMRRPRFIRSHLPIALLPTEFWSVKPKLVYVARNPKSTAVSYYHQYVNLHSYKGTLEDFLDTFLNDLACSSPFADHLSGYWKLRKEPNILFITYEDMARDLNGVLKKVADFFGKSYTEQQLERLRKYLQEKAVKKNIAVNFEEIFENVADPNYRNHRDVDSYKDVMSDEYQKKFNDWLAKAFTNSDYETNIMLKSLNSC